MASRQSKILKEILNQRKDEVKKVEEFVREWETKEMDLERQYQEKHKVRIVISLFLFLYLFFPAKHTLSFFLFWFINYDDFYMINRHCQISFSFLIFRIIFQKNTCFR